jgi:hypothetical protein
MHCRKPTLAVDGVLPTTDRCGHSYQSISEAGRVLTANSVEVLSFAPRARVVCSQRVRGPLEQAGFHSLQAGRRCRPAASAPHRGITWNSQKNLALRDEIDVRFESRQTAASTSPSAREEHTHEVPSVRVSNGRLYGDPYTLPGRRSLRIPITPGKSLTIFFVNDFIRPCSKSKSSRIRRPRPSRSSP